MREYCEKLSKIRKKIQTQFVKRRKESYIQVNTENINKFPDEGKSDGLKLWAEVPAEIKLTHLIFR